MPNIPDPLAARQNPFHPRVTVGRGLRSTLGHCPQSTIIHSSKMLKDGRSIEDAFNFIEPIAMETDSPLILLRTADIAGQLPEGPRRDKALNLVGVLLMHVMPEETLADRLLLESDLRFADNTARNIGMTAYHFIEEGQLSLAQAMLSVGAMLGLQHERLDGAQQRFDTVGTEYDDGGSGFAPRGTLNKHASPAWGRALDS